MRTLLVMAISLLMWLSSLSPVWALTQIKLSDLSYHTCSVDVGRGAVTAGGTTQTARCFIVTGKATNPTNKTIVNADIFGRIYDANDDPIIENRTRLGAIEEVPPGVSDFELQISVPLNQPLPLKLQQFKAAGFTGVVRR